MLPDFWAPLSAKRLFAAGSGPAANEAEERSLCIIGRLRPGVTEAEAQSGMSVLIPRISQSRQRELQLVDASLESRATYQSCFWTRREEWFLGQESSAARDWAAENWEEIC